MKYEYNIVCVKKIARTKFDIGHCPIKVKVNVSPQNIFYLSQCQISTLVNATGN